MPQIASAGKSSETAASSPSWANAAGKHGVSRRAPRSGIAFVDETAHGSNRGALGRDAHSTPSQLKNTIVGLKGRTGSLLGSFFGNQDFAWKAEAIDDGYKLTASQSRAITLPGKLSVGNPIGALQYTDAGGLEGKIGLSVTCGTAISGKVTLGYAEGAFRVEGTLSVNKLLPGVSKISLDMDYGGADDWYVGLKQDSSVTVNTRLLGVPLNGELTRLEMGSAGRLKGEGGGASLSAGGNLKAKLPLVGPVAVEIKLADNALQTVSVSAKAIPIDIAAGKIKIDGSLSGKASWDVPKSTFSGKLSGAVTVTVTGGADGLSPIPLSFSIEGGKEGAFSVAAKLNRAVDLNRFVTISALDAKYANEAVSFNGKARVKLPLVGPIDGAVEITESELKSICLTAEKIPINITRGKLTVNGELSGNAAWDAPEGTLSGKLGGSVTVRMAGGAGGLKPIALSFSVEGGKKEEPISVAATLDKAVDLNRFVRIVELNPSYANEAVSFNGKARVKLPLVGPIDGAVKLTENELESIRLSADRIPVDVTRGKLSVGGTLSGNAAWNVPANSLSGKLSGTVTVGMTSGGTRGAAGGLSPISLSFSVEGKGRNLDVDAKLVRAARVSSFLRIDTLNGSYKDEALSFAGSISLTVPKIQGSGQATFDETNGFAFKQVRGKLTLPLLGELTAEASFDQLVLKDITLSALSPQINFPVANPILTGTVKGGATWDVEKGTIADGNLGVNAQANVPGVKAPIPIGVSVAGGEEGVSVRVWLPEPVQLHHFLKLSELSGSEENGLFVITGTAAIQNLGGASKNAPAGTGARTRGQPGGGRGPGASAGGGASVSVRIDDAKGFQVTGAGASFSFSVGKGFSAEVTVKYDSTTGIAVDGSANLQFGPISASVALQTRGGLFDAEISVPSRATDKNKLTNAKTDDSGALVLFGGYKLDGQKLPFKLPTFDIAIFSFFYLATLSAQIGLDFEYGIGIDPLTVKGSAAVKGLNLADGTMEELLVRGIVKSGISAYIVFGPKVGLTLSVIHPKLLGFTGGLALDARATAGMGIVGNVALSYKPGQGLDLSKAEIVVPVYISLDVDPKLYIEISALLGLFTYEWRTEAIASLQVLKDKQLFNVRFDLAHPEDGIVVDTCSGSAQPPQGGEKKPSGMNFQKQTPQSDPVAPAAPGGGASDPATLLWLLARAAQKYLSPRASKAKVPPTQNTAPPPAETSQSRGGSGMFDLSMLFTVLDAVMPEPIRKAKKFFEDIYNAVKDFINGFIKFIDWISDRVRRILDTDEEVKLLVNEVLGAWKRLQNFDLIALWDLICAFVSLVKLIARKLIRELLDDRKLVVVRRRNVFARGTIFEWDDIVPDDFDVDLDIPGILTWSGRLKNVFSVVDAIFNWLGVTYTVVEGD